MSPVTQQGFLPSAVSVTVPAATDSNIINLSLVLSNTEYSQALTAGLKQIIIRSRDNQATLKLSFVLGESGTKYLTLLGGNSLSLAGLDFTSKTLYIQSSKTNTVIEIMELF